MVAKTIDAHRADHNSAVPSSVSFVSAVPADRRFTQFCDGLKIAVSRSWKASFEIWMGWSGLLWNRHLSRLNLWTPYNVCKPFRKVVVIGKLNLIAIQEFVLVQETLGW